MAQAVSDNGDDFIDIGVKTVMVYRMHPNRHSGFGVCTLDQFTHQMGMLNFAAHRRTVFTVEGDIEHAHTKFLLHVGLNGQTLTHARFHAAVMVTHRQYHRACLRNLQDVARVFGKRVR